MGLCGWIVFGFLAGLIARALMPGTQKMGLIATTLLGIAGSFVGGFFWNLFHHYSPFDLRPSGFIGSVVGAIVLLVVGELVNRRR
ncbi:MAG: GlsB/YeaQ/YmgE family stress response membrane protein [Myxococcaceae bacterium]|nr:GlsB/YeaQ/YmgE family stress response membrane protein [Myxococcaceae bacterium]